jgi:hypothetical protein
MRDREEVAKQLAGGPGDAAHEHNPKDNHRDKARLPVHLVMYN